MTRRFATVLALLVCCSAAPAAAQRTVPRQEGFLTDVAGVVNLTCREAIDSAAAEIWRATPAQVVVLTLPALDGRTLVQWAEDVGNAWRVGYRAEGADTTQALGAVIVMAVDAKAVRVATSRGLDSLIGRRAATRVQEEFLIPAFQRGNYGAGLLGAVHGLHVRIAEALGQRPPRARPGC